MLNDDVAVVGLGPIGLMAIALAKAAGARNVYAIQRSGRSKARIELAKKLRASYAAPALWFPRALDLLKNKVIDPDDFITQTFPLEEIRTWFEKQRDDISDVIKMVMVKE